MSAIPPIDVAASNRPSSVPVSSEGGGTEPGQPFAEVMRSAVSPAQAPQSVQKTFYHSNASGTLRPQFNRSIMPAGANSNPAEEPASASSSQDPTASASIRAGDLDGENVDSPAASALPSAGTSEDQASLVDGQTQSSISAAAVGDRLSEATPQRVRADDTETGSSPALNGRKPTSSAKGANESQGASGATAIATTASLAVASVSAILPNLPIVDLPTGSSAVTESKSGTKLNDGPTLMDASSLSNRATAPGLAMPTAPADGTAGAAGTLPHGPGISTGGMIDSHTSVTADGNQSGVEARGATSNSATTANTDATSAANQNGGSDGSGGSQPASAPDGTLGHGSTTGSSNSSADTNTSNAVSATGTGNSDTATNAPVGDGGTGSATSIHNSNGSKSSSATAAMPSASTAAKSLPGQQATPATSGVRLQNNSNIFSSATHSSAPGSFPSSTASSTAARATTADAFTALDSVAAGERGVLLHAAPHQVSVGVTDPSLGWVEVRAERVSGQIAAALTTSSSASHAALTSVLPTMATYLQEHHAGVQQVHVESSLTGGQAGTGSQGQTASQSDAQTSSNNSTVASSASSPWNAAPIATATIPASQGTNYLYEGHHFSIRA
ncbi:MAG: hypothetical protein WA700_06280 [Acidobacteriaceae bacterium]